MVSASTLFIVYFVIGIFEAIYKVKLNPPPKYNGKKDIPVMIGGGIVWAIFWLPLIVILANTIMYRYLRGNNAHTNNYNR